MRNLKWICGIGLALAVLSGAIVVGRGVFRNPATSGGTGMDVELARVCASRGIPPLRELSFLALPPNAFGRTLGPNEFIPGLGQYVSSLDGFDVAPIDARSSVGTVTKEECWIAPDLTSVGVPPRGQWGGAGAEQTMTGSASLGARVSAPVYGVGDVRGSMRVDRAARIRIAGVHALQVDLGDTEYLAELASVYTGKPSRIYFVHTIYTADVDADDMQGFSESVEATSATGARASFGGEVRRSAAFSGRGLVVGCKFQRLASSLNTTAAGAPQRPDQIAQSLASTLGLSIEQATDLVSLPARIEVREGGARVMFESPFASGKQRVRALDTRPPFEASGSVAEIPLGATHDLQYSAHSGNRFYVVRMRVRVDDDRVQQIARPQFTAASWVAFDPVEEFLARRRETASSVIARARELASELAADALFAFAGPAGERAEQVARLRASAPFVELSAALTAARGFEAPAGGADAVSLRFADAVRTFVDSGVAPTAELVEELERTFEAAGDGFAMARWMRADVGMRSAKSPEELVAATESLERAFEAAQSPELRERILNVAVAAHIQAGTDLAAQAEASGLALMYAAPIEAIRRRGLRLIAAGKVKFPRLTWEGKSTGSSLPSPWVKTTYVPGGGVSAGVRTATDGTKRGWVEANAGSVQVSSLVNIPLDQLGHVSWNWRALRLPAEGNCLDSKSDDAAIQVVLVFLTRDNTVRALNYVWDSSAPVGSVVRGRELGFANFKFPVSYLVVARGEPGPGGWAPVRRVIADDWKHVFGDEPLPPVVASVTVQANGQYTRASVSGEISEILFTPEPIPAERELQGRD